MASTDMGNVSQLVPSIHPLLGYDVGGAAHHTAEFAAYGSSASADRAVLDGAFGLTAAAGAAARDPGSGHSCWPAARAKEEQVKPGIAGTSGTET
ncbi:hypothetical protein [Arthrobacter sp. ISL-69]|uniref:hypothetical protein n=1 Tax=Arthrobacter sp. ISL-69 TaxID=2819113 RepID=UPI001BE9FFA1|nr:hypothetical protein [Arthrobacter sp. ISL-69]MBT2535655.1 hypothetical protein [Arthrobacter sp. ISL-69]